MGEQISLCTVLKYLGWWFDGKLTFKEHAKQTAAKAEKVVVSISWLMSNLGRLSEGECKLLVNVTMLVLLCGALIRADAINAREYRRTEMVLVQQKAALRCVSAYSHCLHRGSLCASRYTPIEIVVDKHKRVYSHTHWINPRSGKALWVRHEERQVMLYKWKETILWKLERKVDPSVNTQPLGMVGERPWTDELQLNTGYVRSWGVQRLTIPHDASWKPRMCQLRQRKVRWWCLAHPVWVSSISTVPGGSDDHPTRDGWTVSYTGQFDPDYAEKRRWMGPGGRLCRFDNAQQDADCVRAADAANSRRHPAPNARPRHTPMFAISNPAMEENDPGWSTSETNDIHKHLSLGSKKRESVVPPSTHANKQRRNWGRKVACLKVFPLALTQARWGDPGQGSMVFVGPIWHVFIAIHPDFRKETISRLVAKFRKKFKETSKRLSKEILNIIWKFRKLVKNIKEILSKI